MTIQTIGLPGVLAGFAARQAQINAAMPTALEHGAEVVRDAWVANIEGEPLILTGAYRDSIQIVTDENVVGVKTDVPYAGILEYGDSRQAAHPVLHRATDEHHEQVLDREADVIRTVLR